jgi:hypothetical protein
MSRITATSAGAARAAMAMLTPGHEQTGRIGTNAPTARFYCGSWLIKQTLDPTI